MKEEINAAAEFISRIFLANDSVSKAKVNEFNQHLSEVLEERFRDHWHETCPTKGQAYRCIRVCPEEALDPILEKVCIDVGVNCSDFNLPIELTLWVDPKEVICKIGDLKCSYHTVAKKDQTSGNLHNKTDNMDIDDLIESARELYIKKQTVVIHPIHSTEMHILSPPYSDGSPSGITMAVRMNGTNAVTLSSSPPTSYDGSPRGKGNKPGGNGGSGANGHSMHHQQHHSKGRGFHSYGKSTGGKGTFVSNGTANANHHLSGGGNGGSHASGGGGFPQHRTSSSHHHGGHHQNHHGSHHPAHSNHHGGSSYYQNGYLNGYHDEGTNGYAFGERSGSPSKLSGGPASAMSQGSPTPEQIQQQMQHPPPLPPHMQGGGPAFSHPPGDPTSLPPPPQGPPPPQSSGGLTGTTTPTSSSSSSNNNNNNGSAGGKINSNSNSGSSSGGKFQGGRGAGGRNSRQSPVKELK